VHLSEGVLSSEILIGSALLLTPFIYKSFHKLEPESLPHIAVFSALFFLASFIHIPIGPTSAHLLMSGIIGAVLGIRAFAAIFIALFLQGLLFGYGGITTLGVNTLIIATPSLIARGLYIASLRYVKFKYMLWFLCGALPVFVSGVLFALVLLLDNNAFLGASAIMGAAHIPLMAMEGVITLFILRFIKRVAPELMEIK
jgi:cobalt/nickel transport system permease protein